MPPESDASRSTRVTPDALARMTFPTVRRGFDPDRVRVFLDKVAAELRDTRDREAALRTELEALQSKLDSAMRPDEAQLTAALGEETARVLLAAREAATEIRSKGEESVARLLKEAQEEAARVKGEADTILADRTREAEAAVAGLREAAEAEAATVKADTERAVALLREEADAVVERARVDADRVRTDAAAQAEAVLEAARAQGREMIDEAQLVRTRMLEDLSRKRKAARVQLERLQAGRERLLDSYEVVRRTLAEATEELTGSLVAAKHVADAAAHRAEVEPPASVEQLEAEVEAARDAGLPLVTDADDEHDDDEFADLPEGEMPEIVPSADYETVRVIEPAESEPEIEPEPDVAPEAEAEIEVVVVDEVIVIDDEEATDDDDMPDVDVDGLFARIRAARAEQVARAREVLGEDTPDTEAEAEPEGGADVEPEVEVGPESEAEAEGEGGPDAEVDDVSPSPASPDEQALLERRDAVVDAAEQTATRKLKRVLADEQNDVLDRLRRKPKATLADLLPSEGEHAQRYADAARGALADVAAAGAQFYAGGGSAGSVDDLADQLGEALAMPLRDRIAACLREGAGDEDALADGVRATYRDWKTHRIGMQARDTMFAAFNRGLYDATSEGTSLRWLVDDGGSPCPDAEDNSLAGLVLRGEPYPTGHCYPPAHPGCRCLLVPADH